MDGGVRRRSRVLQYYSELSHVAYVALRMGMGSEVAATSDPSCICMWDSMRERDAWRGGRGRRQRRRHHVRTGRHAPSAARSVRPSVRWMIWDPIRSVSRGGDGVGAGQSPEGVQCMFRRSIELAPPARRPCPIAIDRSLSNHGWRVCFFSSAPRVVPDYGATTAWLQSATQ